MGPGIGYTKNVADERDEIRRRANLVDLVGQRVSLKKAGKDWKGLCPFHEDRNPSFVVNPEFGRYRCWACGATGDVFDWVMKTQNVDFAEAMQILAKETGVELRRGKGEKRDPAERERQEGAMEFALRYFREELGKSPVAREYVQKRGLPNDVMKRWEIGYAPNLGEALAVQLGKSGYNLNECMGLYLVHKDSQGGFYDRFRGRLMFPIRDERGLLVAFGGRIIGDGQPKYINSSDTPLYHKSRVLYGMHLAKEVMAKSRRAVLCEGYMDVIACHRAGVTSAVASLGTALAEDQVRLLKRWCDEVVILYDADTAGKKATERACELLEAEGLRVKVAQVGEGKDPDDLLEAGGPEAVQRIVDQAVSPMEFRLGVLRERLSPADDAYWPEVVAILATAPSALEMERYLLPIAREYPGIRDPIVARRALEEMVRDYKADQKRRAKKAALDKAATVTESSSEEGGHVSGRSGIKRVPKLTGPETAVFRALLEPGLRDEAWAICLDPELFATTVGQKMARYLTEALVEVPTDPPSVWLGQIENEATRTALADLLMDQFHPVTERVLQDAQATLMKEREIREVRVAGTETNGQQDLENLHKRLKKLKNGEIVP